MASNKIVPLIPNYSYEFNTILEDLNIKFYVRWSFTDLAWYINMDVVETGSVVNGMKLVGGVDLLKQYAIIELGKMYIVDTEEKFQNPDFDLIGDRYKLVYILKENADGFPL